ncbi:MAG TPA: carbonic anhydrase [Urbifossiella sp.]|jgi:carbonic anhydrase|nr:carbonic anhydrase [Urbifossiella sp.]
MNYVTRFRIPADGVSHLPADHAEALRWLTEGNARYAAEQVGPLTTPGVTPRQNPYGVILGCSDARAPLELVLDAGPNELFVVRVAGNVLGDEALGSIEYALANFRPSLRLLTVLGHTGCGAVAAAVDTYLSPKHAAGIAFSRSVRAVVNHILVAVRSAAISLEQTWGAGVANDPGFPAALAEAAVYLNAATTAYHLSQELRPEDSGVRVVQGVFDLADGVIGTIRGGVLQPAPAGPEDMVELGQVLASSPRVTRHLSKGTTG